MTETVDKASEENEISILDILLILVESWRLLVFGPIVAAVLAGFISIIWPKTFESIAIVRLTEEDVALLHTSSVLDPLIEKFGILTEEGYLDDARQALKSRLTFVFDKKTKLVTVAAKGRTPESAQILCQTALDILLIELQPKGKEKEAILQEIAINNQLISDGVYLIERQSGRQTNAAGSNNGKSQIVNLKLNNLELNLKLQSKGKEIFAQEPSLPQRKISPNKTHVVASAFIGSSFCIAILIFLRAAWNNSKKDPICAKKIKKIKYHLSC